MADVSQIQYQHLSIHAAPPFFLFTFRHRSYILFSEVVNVFLRFISTTAFRREAPRPETEWVVVSMGQ